MNKTFLAAAAVLMLASAPVLANEGPGGPDGHKGPRHEERFKQSDTNGDGVLSRDEFLAENAKRAGDIYGKLDANSDGKLTQEEMKTGHEKMRAKMKERWQEKKAKQEAEGKKAN